MIVGPLLLLVVLELGLRLAGCGYPTAFFLNYRQGDRPMLTDNPKFGWRFFPSEVARAPWPLFLAARKPPGTVRIFVLGESAAMGDPEPSYGFARQLGQILQARHPDQTIEIVNAAMTAINSHVILEIARDCGPREGDFWLVFAGNNEVIGPYGAGTVFGRQALGLAAVRFSLALKSTRVVQLLARMSRSSREPANWEGLELFLGQQVPREDPRLKNVYANFAANLSDIAKLGRQSGATVLFATVPVNLRDSPPFASLHRPGLRPDELAEWEKCFATGTRAQNEGRFDEALSAYRKADQIDGEFAQLVFQRANCELELKQSALAETDFRLARDLDTLRFRTDSRINEIIREIAPAKGVSLTDADQQFARRPEGIPGDDLFYDHVHLNFTGNYRLAVLFATEFEKHWPGAQAPASPWLSEAEVARRLAFTDFDQRRINTEMRARLQQPPFAAQSNFRLRDEHWRETIAALSAPPASLSSNYQAAVALAPEDWLLHANFARLLEAAGDDPRATAQWLEVARLLPDSPQAWASLGRLARIAGDQARAEDYLREGLKQQPDSVELLTESGISKAGRGATQDALHQFRAALRLQPGFTPARVNLGVLLAHEGDAAGAATQYREELRWHTNNVDARINLANLLSTQGQTGQAMVLYEQAVKLQPENPIARYNFGRLRAANNRPADAVTNFEAALQQRPDTAEIHYELGNALARLGKDPDALAQFAEAARLKPDLVDARFNYGVALARSARYTEAVAEFRATLRLRPQHALAQRMLDEASRAARQSPRAPPN
jgi:tetratricopeptide (TPR) repeat protein